MVNLVGKVCLVTGATRGIGKGIALQLAQAGATVYVTGRNQDTLNNVVNELRDRGAHKAIALQVDHSKDDEVEGLFKRIRDDQNGQLDVLVNNAYAAVDFMIENERTPIHVLHPTDSWDLINGVGLRNHYACTAWASRMMVERRSGLIVNVSSFGGLTFLHNTPYGIGKAAMDRMAADCAVDLRKHNVCMVSLWPGPVKTETMIKGMNDTSNAARAKAMTDLFGPGETPEFTGKAVAHLASDPHVMRKTGRIQMTLNLAHEYSFTENDGSLPVDVCSVKYLLHMTKHTWLSAITPAFVRIPLFALHYASYKF